MTTDATETVLDESAGIGEHGYSLTRIHRTPSGHTVRVRVVLDTREPRDLSSAVAEVLTLGLTWTGMVDTPPSRWRGRYPSPAVTEGDVVAELSPVATELYRRAVTVLSGGGLS